ATYSVKQAEQLVTASIERLRAQDNLRACMPAPAPWPRQIRSTHQRLSGKLSCCATPAWNRKSFPPVFPKSSPAPIGRLFGWNLLLPPAIDTRRQLTGSCWSFTKRGTAITAQTPAAQIAARNQTRTSSVESIARRPYTCLNECHDSRWRDTRGDSRMVVQRLGRRFLSIWHVASQAAPACCGRPLFRCGRDQHLVLRAHQTGDR